MNATRALAAALLTLFPFCTANSDSLHLVLCGSGGEREYSDRFHDWGQRLVSALESQANVPAENIIWLAEGPENLPAGATPIGSAQIDSAFSTLAGRAGPDDDVYIYLIGHGSAYGMEPRFHVPGPDVGTEDFRRWLDSLNVRRIAVLNATSASAGFINELSAPGRIICTATKSMGEFNATHFMEFFIQGLTDGSADRNRDDRVSFHEACAQASELTAAYYTSEGLIATEHAILDDNSDGLGTRLFDPDAPPADEDSRRDGTAASKLFLKDYSFPDTVPKDLVDAYLASLDAVESWKENKEDVDSAAYYEKLEDLLVKAARLNRDIHRFYPPDTGNS